MVTTMERGHISNNVFNDGFITKKSIGVFSELLRKAFSSVNPKNGRNKQLGRKEVAFKICSTVILA